MVLATGILFIIMSYDVLFSLLLALVLVFTVGAWESFPSHAVIQVSSCGASVASGQLVYPLL
jgi:hypothetical protein